MSIRLMSFVWDNGPDKINHRMVLLALADFANDSGTCWPSIATLCRKTTLSERTVQGCIRDLESEGWLTRTLGGGARSSQYTVTPAGYAPVQDLHPRRMRPAPPQDVPLTPAPRAPKPLVTINEPSSKKDCAFRFDEFWNVYPHRGGAKKGRHPAEISYAKAVRAGVSEKDIIEGAKRAGHDRQVLAGYGRLPSTWLNQKGWEDEIDTSRETQNGKTTGQDRLNAFLAGASSAPRLDSWPDSNPSQPLLAGR